MNINRAMHSNRIMKSLTGLNVEKFKELIPFFEAVLLEDTKQKIKSDINRKRAVRKDTLHKVFTFLTDNFQYITTEDLNIKGMI